MHACKMYINVCLLWRTAAAQRASISILYKSLAGWMRGGNDARPCKMLDHYFEALYCVEVIS